MEFQEGMQAQNSSINATALNFTGLKHKIGIFSGGGPGSVKCSPAHPAPLKLSSNCVAANSCVVTTV